MGEVRGDYAGGFPEAVGVAATSMALLFCRGDFEERESLLREGLAGGWQLLPRVACKATSPSVEGGDLEDGAF